MDHLDIVAGTRLAHPVAAWLAVNLPFVIRAREAWWEFFRFNGARPPDWDSGWYIACRAADAACLDTRTVNVVSALLFVAVFAGLWVWKASRSPDRTTCR